MRRPLADECGTYFLGYTNRVDADDVLAALARQLEDTRGLLASLDDERARHRYAPGKWSVKEVLGHLADTERVFTVRALHFARGDTQPLPGFEEDAFVAGSSFHERPLAAILDEYATVRAATLSLFRGLSGEALERRGTANDTTIVCRAVPWILAGHELHHVGVLRERYGVG